ncbi:hypothetical protein Cgig2_029152 [Carnegiea gigantea]|uniref:Sn1-specific diacylglycerol lipase alpha n=1 Tax=Carnegiea gigantea TaxID=171969 RepID=A0A9Q1QJI0_9CARY|nr:hypothetical protein Cgig2_029152 [Carnegiea gigantea]
MATATMATAAGAVLVLYFLLSRRISSKDEDHGGDRSRNNGGDSKSSRSMRRKISRRPAQAPATWFETITTLSETLRFTYSETLGKWPIGDLAFGINYLMRRQLLKPAFTILSDHGAECFLLLIRGTHSIKDTLTAATGAVVPFHHSVLHDGGISNLILGYAHCGMVAAARWIAKLSTPCLLKALSDFPDYSIKIVGHSLGGGTAALLTYILREQKEFSSSTCVTFAPAACMTWELAESGKHFVTTVINGSDLVPTFSTASIDDLRSEVVMKGAQNVAQAVARTRPTLSSWSCMGARRRHAAQSINLKEDEMPEASLISTSTSEALVAEEELGKDTDMNHVDYNSSSSVSGQDNDMEEEDEQLMAVDKDITTSTMEAVTEGELWYQLEKELKKQDEEAEVQAREEEAAAAQEITEEANVLANAVENNKAISSSDMSENHRFYPPGRIMHMVCIRLPSNGSSGDDPGEEHACVYETPRHLYSKIRLTKTMINDHYMPMYKKMMEQLIHELECDEDCICSTKEN